MTSRIIVQVTSPTNPPDSSAPDPEEGQETYLCSYRNHFFFAPTGSVDRTKEVRCLSCSYNTLSPWWDEETITDRLMKGTI